MKGNEFWIGDHVRHVDDSQRRHGVVVRAPEGDMARVRWFGPHEPEDWEEELAWVELAPWPAHRPKRSRTA